METLYKYFDTEIKAGLPDDRTINFVISTGAVDRDGDVLDPTGWDLKHYLKNPTVLWSHDYSQLPIAKAIKVEATDKALTATAQFPPPGSYPFADTVYDMLKGGFLSATSVGFRPVESEPIKGGRAYKRQELLEFSVVPVPANQEALMQRGVTGAQAKAWKDAVKGWAEPKKTAWDLCVEKVAADHLLADDADPGKLAEFYADLKIETEDGAKPIGAARLARLAEMNGVAKAAIDADSMPEMSVAQDIHSNAMQARMMAAKAQQLIEKCNVKADMPAAYREQLQEAHQSCGMAAAYAGSAADRAHGMLLRGKAADQIEKATDEPTLDVEEPMGLEVSDEFVEIANLDEVVRIVGRTAEETMNQIIFDAATKSLHRAMGRVI